MTARRYQRHEMEDVERERLVSFETVTILLHSLAIVMELGENGVLIGLLASVAVIGGFFLIAEVSDSPSSP